MILCNVNVPGTKKCSIEDVVKYCWGKERIGLDTETTGLDPHTSEVVTIQLGDENKQFVIDCRNLPYNKLKRLRPIIESDSIQKVLVNAKFDYKMLLSNFGWRIENLHDCMINEMILECNDYIASRKYMKGKFSLKGLAKKYLNYEYDNSQLSLFDNTIYKSTGKEFVNLGDQQLTYDLIRYCATDVEFPLKILEQQLELSEELITTINLERKFLPCLAEMEYNGLYLNKTKWLELEKNNIDKLLEKEQELKNYLIDNNYDDYIDINWNSSQQVSALFNEIGIPILIKDKDKSSSDKIVWKKTVAESHIAKYGDEYPIINKYLEYKHLFKALSTYGKKFLKNIHPTTGRIHSNFWQILATGRISSSGPNLQNIPNTKEFRSCFTNQYSDTVLIVADYSGQETRVMAEQSKDKALVDFLLYGDGDHHSYTAKMIFNVNVSKTENAHLRPKGKKLNFEMSYGAGPNKVADDMRIPFEEADKLVKSYWKAYNGLKRHFEYKAAQSMRDGFILIDNVTKRKTKIFKYGLMLECKEHIDYFRSRNWEPNKAIQSMYYRIKGDITRMSQNYPIQGTSGSMTKLAAILLRKWIKNNHAWNIVKLVNMVHDEIILEVKKWASKKVSTVLQQSMETAGKVFCKKIPMTADAVISNH